MKNFSILNSFHGNFNCWYRNQNRLPFWANLLTSLPKLVGGDGYVWKALDNGGVLKLKYSNGSEVEIRN